MSTMTRDFNNTCLTYESCSALEICENPNLFDDSVIGFILPGIVGEDCYFADQLGEQGIQTLKSAVEQKSLSILGICAGSNYLAETIYYETYEGTQKHRKPGLDFFQATAKGPIPTYARPPCKEAGDLNDCTVVHINYTNTSGTQGHTGICYGNGPILLPHSDNNSIETIATYRDVENNPVAIAATQPGEGLAIFSGVLPEISGIDNPNYNGLSKELVKHEEGRNAVFKMLINRMIEHHNIKRNDNVPLLKI